MPKLRILLLLFLSTPCYAKWYSLWDQLAGADSRRPLDQRANLSPAAAQLLKTALEGVPYIIDSHMHLVGFETESTGCYLNSNVWKFWNFRSWASAHVLLRASGAGRTDQGRDARYVEQLSALVNGFWDVPYYGLLFAFTKTYTTAGAEDLAHTGLYVPNEYMLNVVKQNTHLLPVASVHPYDPEAIAKLRQLAQQGVRFIKLLPNSMHFDPSDPKLKPYVAALAKLKLILIAHVGDEHSVSGGGIENSFGNPLLYEAWLKQFPNLKLIMAHVGSEGVSKVEGERRKNFNLVVELIERYPQQVFADLSALSSVPNRIRYMRNLLEKPKLYPNLIYGSDYPILSARSLVWAATNTAAWKELITSEQRDLLLELDLYNPLVAGFVFMRTMRAGEHSLPVEVFGKNLERLAGTSLVTRWH